MSNASIFVLEFDENKMTCENELEREQIKNQHGYCLWIEADGEAEKKVYQIRVWC